MLTILNLVAKCTLNGRVWLLGDGLRVRFFSATLLGYPTENVRVRALHHPAAPAPDSRLTAAPRSA